MREIDGNTYCFGDDALLLYGWISYGGGLYYSGQDGAVCKGETMIDGKKYYFDPDGVMLWDTAYSIFRFDSNGVATQLPASLENLDDYLDYLLSVNTGDDGFARIWYGVRSSITYKIYGSKQFFGKYAPRAVRGGAQPRYRLMLSFFIPYPLPV